MNKTKKDRQKRSLLVKVARLYYEQNYNQNEIAKIVNLSRPYISKLLLEAKETEIVQITIKDDVDTESKKEKQIREFFNLNKVIIAPKSDSQLPLTLVGEATALYLESILCDGDIIGYSWGETIYECAKALSVQEALKNIVTVQLCGGVSNTNKNVYVSEISTEFSHKLNSTGYLLPFPAIVDSFHIKDTLYHERSMQDVLSYASKANICIITMGKFDTQCAMARVGYLSESEVKQLTTQGVVGDICTHLIDKEGHLCVPQMDARTVAVPLKTLKNIDTRIGVAVGEDKVYSILGALRGNLINILVTDEATADLLCEICPEILL